MKGLVSLVVCLCGLMAEPLALAGILVAPELKWGVFAPRPEGEEATPNYYSYGGGLHLGFSVKQVLDVAAFGMYLPGRLDAAKWGADDAFFAAYGGEVALRIKKMVYVGLRGGLARYELKQQRRSEELPGIWAGPAAGISLGAIQELSKSGFLQVSLDFTHGVLSPQQELDEDEVGLGKRRIDAFTVSLGYVFNDYTSYLIENTIFKNFLDSAVFF